MKYINLIEYDKIGKEISFSNKEALLDFQHAVNETNLVWKNRLGLSRDPFYWNNASDEKLSFFVRGVTGFVKINDFSFEIKPKFLDVDSNEEWKVALTNLLFLQENPLKYKSNMVQSKVINKKIPDLLANKFLSELEKALLLGLPKGYVFKEEAVPFYKGTYNIHKAIDHLTVPHLIPCKFDDYVEDILINRIIKLAGLELSRLVKDSTLSFKLEEKVNQINAHTQIPSLFEIERSTLPLQFGYLETLFDLSKIVLTNNSIMFSEGKFKNSGFLWNTHVIFEDFIKNLVRLICKKNKNFSFTDKELRLYTLANDIATKSRKKGSTSPDIRVFDSTSLRWLLDAKYKNWENGPKIEDVYQISTGAQLTKIEKASLIYPKGPNTPDEQVFYNLNTISSPNFFTCIFIDLLKLAEPKGLDLLVEDLESDLMIQ